MGDLTKNFSRWEFACRCAEKCGFDTIDFKVLEVLQRLRDHFESPITINSGCRCEAHNIRVHGDSKSQHLKGRAVDFTIEYWDPYPIYQYLNKFWEGGLGKYATFTHIDSRSSRARWG